jgi:rhodanese-related sulfurtransferase
LSTTTTSSNKNELMQGPGYKDVTPRELKEKLDRGEEPVLLDVREPWEFSLSRIEGSKLIPMADIFDCLHDLDPHAETVVLCHHGARSAYVTRILDRSGFDCAYNLEGGLDAYSYVDASVSRY